MIIDHSNQKKYFLSLVFNSVYKIAFILLVLSNSKKMKTFQGISRAFSTSCNLIFVEELATN